MCMVYFKPLVRITFPFAFLFRSPSIQSINFNFDFNSTKIQFGCAFRVCRDFGMVWWNCYHLLIVYGHCLFVVTKHASTFDVRTEEVSMQSANECEREREGVDGRDWNIDGWNIIGNLDRSEMIVSTRARINAYVLILIWRVRWHITKSMRYKYHQHNWPYCCFCRCHTISAIANVSSAVSSVAGKKTSVVPLFHRLLGRAAVHVFVCHFP